MSKNISILGGHMLTAAIAGALVSSGHGVMIDDNTPVYREQKKARKPIDISDYQPPKNGYQKKQRRRKAQRKSKI